MKPKTAKVHFFVCIEMLMALGLMLLLSVCYFASLKTIDRMDRAFTNDARALQVISNTVERLDRQKHYSPADIKRIFTDEFDKGGFPENSKISTNIKAGTDSSTLTILKANGKAIIEVKIKCRK